MRRLTARETTVLAAGVALAILVILYVGVFGPAMTQLSVQQRRVTQETRDKAALQAVVDRLPAAEQNVAATRTALQRAMQQIPPTIDQPQIIALLAQAMGASRVRLVEITFPSAPTTQAAPAAGLPTVQELAFHLVIEGTWPNAVAFLGQAEALPRLVGVQTITLTAGGATSGPGPILRAALDVRAFALQ